jgi:hypothetical protein
MVTIMKRGDIMVERKEPSHGREDIIRKLLYWTSYDQVHSQLISVVMEKSRIFSVLFSPWLPISQASCGGVMTYRG